MRLLALFLSLIFISSCSKPAVNSELSHMRKSMAIDIILQNMDQVNYDESFSELDRDKLKLGYASDFYKEVFSLTSMLKKSSMLPNNTPIPKEKEQAYKRVIKLLDSNLDYLKKVIERKDETLILSAVKTTEKSCIQCHNHFKSSL